MIRLALATEKDVEELINLGEEFHAKSGYNNLSFSREKLSCILHEVLGEPNFLLLTAKHGKVIVGVFFGQLQETFFGTDVSAYDVCFYLKEEYRGWTATKMLAYYKRWATLMGAKIINLGNSSEISERTSKLYSLLGFEQIGTQHRMVV